MASPENDFDELADMISAAIEKARQLNMHTSAYILSMALAEVRRPQKRLPTSLTAVKRKTSSYAF
jgi:hypothetical protein